jgi:large subunit ribosomal protein L29
MKTKELRTKSVEELQKNFDAFKKELFNLRFQKVQGQIEKTHRVKQIRRAVARVKTLLNEAKIGVKIEKKEKLIKISPKKIADKEAKATTEDEKQKIMKDNNNA